MAKAQGCCLLMPTHENPAKKRNQVLWSDDELLAAVEAYIYMIRLQQRGVACTENMTTPLLMAGPLAGRNDASIRYRMRNISAVLHGLNAQILDIYSPAEQVGAGVRERLRKILLAHPAFELIKLTSTPRSPGNLSRSDKHQNAVSALNDLRKRLDEFEASMGGIGHNHPPEAIEYSFDRNEISKVKEDLARLEIELSKSKPDISVQKNIIERLIGFGLKLSIWMEQRVTKFVDAALVIAAPIVVAKATNMLPSLIEVVHSVTQLIGR